MAVAKNYAKHKVEMGGTPAKLEHPAIFLKPNSSVIYQGHAIVKPTAVGELHHEVELGVVIKDRCKHVKAIDWRRHVEGYCVGLDMTARDLQAQAKKDGMPWTLGKSWDTFCALSNFIPLYYNAAGGFQVRLDPHMDNATLWLAVDGVEKQRGSTSDMLAKVPELIEYISSVMTLEAGDIILTGTPEGVGPVNPGQTITAGVEYEYTCLRDKEIVRKGASATVTFPVVAEGM